MESKVTIVFSQKEKKKSNSDLSKRISRSMESVENIVKNLQEFSKSKDKSVTLRRISSTNDLTGKAISLRDKRRTLDPGLSWSLQSVNEDHRISNLVRDSKLRSDKTSPPEKVSSSDTFIKKLDDEWEVYRSDAGRMFYFSKAEKRSSWKPPRRFKPSLRTKISNSEQHIPFADEVIDDTISMVRDSIREDPHVAVPPGYSEFYDKMTGCIYYEDCMSRTRWDTAQDKDGHLYYYNLNKALGSRSEWTLPLVPSKLVPSRGHFRSQSEVKAL